MFKKISFKILKVILLIIITIFSILITAFLCNFLLNVFKYQKQYGFYDFATNGKNDTYIFDKDLIYRFKSDQNYRNYKTLPTTAKDKTVAMVGDSVTWSFGADDNNTYPLTFEKIYNQNHPQSKISVYNYGVPGYGLDQEYILIQNKILKELKPNIIIWNINQNDIQDSNNMCLFNYQNNRWQKVPATHNIGYWYGWSGSNLPSFIINSNIYNFIWQKFFNIISPATNEPLYTFGCSRIIKNFSTNILITEKLTFFIQELQKNLKNNQVLIITLVPYQKYFDNRFTSDEIGRDFPLVKDTLIKNNINFLDFNEIILNKLQAQTNQFNINFAQKYFLDNNSLDKNPDGLRHPNQKMYDLMAITLKNYVQKNKF